MSKPIQALSLRQPWASAVVLGGKDVENRTRPTKFRGRVIIHAGLQLGMPGWDWDQINWDLEQLTGGPLPRGGFIGEVDIVNCLSIEDWRTRETEPNPWAFGPYCWVLENAIAYPEPIPGKGALGFFKVGELP